MKTLTTWMILSVVFLSAGAFAGASGDAGRLLKAPSPVSRHGENITVADKNRIWPPAGHISMEPCTAFRQVKCLPVKSDRAASGPVEL